MIRLKTPLDEKKCLTLKAGDRVLISGTIYGARDQAHLRLKDETSIPIDLKGAVIYYVGPTPTKPGQVIGSSGPTSAYRMDTLATPLMAQGVKGMIGKGNRSESFQTAMREHKAIYFMSIGGTGALLASKIISQKTVLYEDLGPEALIALEVEDFPCYVAYDLYGGSIFSEDQ